MTWTPERIKVIVDLWQAGHSASYVADVVGGVSRNAVIGKLHRLGLAERPSVNRPAQPVSRGRSKRAKSSEASEAGASDTLFVGNAALKIASDPLPTSNLSEAPSPAPKEARRLTLLQLNERTCKWPIGDPGDSDFGFCGAPKEFSRPYCEAHRRKAYQLNERKSGSRRTASKSA